MSDNPSHELCHANGDAPDRVEQALTATAVALALLQEVTAAYNAEEGPMPTCSICSQPYTLSVRWQEDYCHDCASRNFASVQTTRDAPPPAVSPQDRASARAQDPAAARDALAAYVDSPSFTLTPRQVEAMRRMHQGWVQEARRRVAGEEED